MNLKENLFGKQFVSNPRAEIYWVIYKLVIHRNLYKVSSLLKDHRFTEESTNSTQSNGEQRKI